MPILHKRIYINLFRKYGFSCKTGPCYLYVPNLCQFGVSANEEIMILIIVVYRRINLMIINKVTANSIIDSDIQNTPFGACSSRPILLSCYWHNIIQES